MQEEQKKKFGSNGLKEEVTKITLKLTIVKRWVFQQYYVTPGISRSSIIFHFNERYKESIIRVN